MSRILITGANGQVGQELQRSLIALGEIIAADRQVIDLSQPERIQQVIQEIQPDLIVNAAAYTAVDKAETEFELAETINGTAPTRLAEAAREVNASLIHISTDYVFDGRKNTPYLETDTPNPIGAYARSKWLGEQGVQWTYGEGDADRNIRYIILRTAWVYGTYGPVNFVKTMLRLGAEREELRVVADQVGSPTWAKNLASAIAGFSVRCLNASTSPSGVLEESQQSCASGIYHYTDSGVASWYDFAVAIFEEARSLGFPLKIQRVIPITTADYPTPAKRPAYSVLSTQKTTAVWGTYPPHWRQGLRQMLTELYSYSYESNCSIGR